MPTDEYPTTPRWTEHVRPHALIVTGDGDLRDFLQEGLLVGGFWVSIIASGVQALEVFRLRTFDLVVIDRALPGFDAIELVRRLRRPGAADAGPRTDVPLLVIVDRAGPDVEAALAAGADDALVPPLEIETLAPMLHGVVRAWRARHPDRPWADHLAQRHPG